MTISHAVLSRGASIVNHAIWPLVQESFDPYDATHVDVSLLRLAEQGMQKDQVMSIPLKLYRSHYLMMRAEQETAIMVWLRDRCDEIKDGGGEAFWLSHVMPNGFEITLGTVTKSYRFEYVQDIAAAKAVEFPAEKGAGAL